MSGVKHKKIIIRADGNASIGAGHLMRCLTIADGFQDRADVGFLCADEDSAALVVDRGYDAYVLGTDYRDMEAELPVWKRLFAGSYSENQEGSILVSQKADELVSANRESGEPVSQKADELVSANRESGEPVSQKADELVSANRDVGEPSSRNRVILADSYYITNSYMAGLREYGKVVVLDDMAKIAWNADAVINYNVFAHQEMYEALQGTYGTLFYTGGRYIPIRREFCGRNYAVRERVENILITTGGGDQENIAGQILECIHLPICQYHVVTGRFNPHYDSLLQLARAHQNIHIYHDVRDMAGLMEQSDLAVTAGGTTIYELSAIGVPFVCFSYAENQEKLTEYIGKNKIAGYGGAFHKTPEQTLVSIKEQINSLIENYDLRLRCSKAERQLVDGQGATRIAKMLYGLCFTHSHGSE